ncbi:hypothetical protein [Flavobacterium sp. 140616W15]|uniref:hypothetical protein n=1 Tax=Flavobacterium sp. 140616W15 TaxID=2478552 RepID=UPI000F0CDCB1|nr:hypothetical protein [Flavobacterium sp. 140616W15]AYN05815.1 hypothetical protein EAG11_17885 [Flavobacterium sp. 140616W15]
MKKFLFFLAMIITINVSAQSTTWFGKPLELDNVPASTSKSDSILARGVDKIIKWIPRSDLNGTQNLDKTLANGNTTDKDIIISKDRFDSTINNTISAIGLETEYIDKSSTIKSTSRFGGNQISVSSSDSSDPMAGNRVVLEPTAIEIVDDYGSSSKFDTSAMMFRRSGNMTIIRVQDISQFNELIMPDKSGTFALLSDIPAQGNPPNLQDVSNQKATAILHNKPFEMTSFSSDNSLRSSMYISPWGGSLSSDKTNTDGSRLGSKVQLTGGINITQEYNDKATSVSFEVPTQTNHLRFPDKSGILATIGDIPTSSSQNLQQTMDLNRTWTSDSSYSKFLSIDDSDLGTDNSISFSCPTSSFGITPTAFGFTSGEKGVNHHIISLTGSLPVDSSGSLFFKLPNDKVVNVGNDGFNYVLTTRDEVTFQRVLDNGPAIGQVSSPDELKTVKIVATAINGSTIGGFATQSIDSVDNRKIKKNEFLSSEGSFQINENYSNDGGITSKQTIIEIATPVANTNIKFPAPSVDGTYELALANTTVENNTTVNLSSSYLETTYGGTIVKRVIANKIHGGSLIYEKTSTGWFQTSITPVP